MDLRSSLGRPPHFIGSCIARGAIGVWFAVTAVGAFAGAGCTGNIGAIPDVHQEGETGGSGGGSDTSDNGGTGGAETPANPVEVVDNCREDTGRAAWKLKPQTVFQLHALVAQVFGDAVLNDGQVQAMLANLPTDLRPKGFDTETHAVSAQHVDAYQGLVRRLSGLAATQLPVRRAMEAFVGVDCGGSLDLDTSCGGNFARAFVGALSRVQVPASVADELLTTYGMHKTSYQAQKAYAAFVASVLFSARSALRLETAERDLTGNVSTHELGVRLAATLTAALPDHELRTNMSNGSLSNPEVLASEARRLMRTARGRATLEHFAKQWLDVARLKAPPAREGYLATSEDSARLATAAGAEIGRLFERALIGGRNISEFYDTEDVVPMHTWLSRVYEKPQSSELTRTPHATRSGLLTRVAFHLHGAFSDWMPLAHRGIGVKVTMLCGTVPPIPDNVDFSLPPEAPEVMSSSSYFKVLTERGTCRGCHTAINGYGYAMSAYSVVGEYLQQERVKNTRTGEWLDVPIDTSAAVEIDGAFRMVNGATELSHAIGQSREAQGCFALRFAQYAVGAEVGVLPCGAVTGGVTLEDTLLAFVKSPAFSLR